MNELSKIENDYADEVLQQAKDYYHKIKSIYDSTAYSRLYQVGQTWEDTSGNTRGMISIINSDASAVDSYRLLQNTYVYTANQPNRIKEKMVDWYIDYLIRCGHDLFELDSTFQESPITNPDFCVSRAGRLLTSNFLRSLVLSLEVQKYCSMSKSKFRIVELGGGRGYFARTFKLFIPNSVYIDIDIPETLHFAYLSARLNFPDAKVCYVTDVSQLKDGIEAFDFVFVPTMFAECILQEEFDLFYNTASLGEMDNAAIRHWMDFVQNRLKVKYFFGLNRFLNMINLHDREGQRRLNENECSVLFDQKWKILHWELEPPFARCPYVYTQESRNLQIVAERLPEGSTNEYDNQLLSQQIVEDLMDEDWIRFPDSFYNSMRSNVLANDLTMTGTLFKLWESIRLYPNKTNVAMMILYIHTLSKTDAPLEEWFYYQNLPNDLLSSDISRKAALCSGITLLDEKYEPVWKRALALSTFYNTFNIIGFLPSFMHPFLRSLLIKIPLPPLVKRLLPSKARLP